MIPARIGAINYAMRVLLATPMLLFATVLASCQSATDVDAAAKSGPRAAAAATLRHSFLAGDAFSDDYRRLGELETEALRLAEDEPLKLGAIGTAILDLCQGSLTGHYALHRFYTYLDSSETAASHAAWVTAVKADMTANADGTSTNPYIALTPVEAQIFVMSESLSPVGSIYQSDGPASFSMLVVGRPKAGALREMHFDLGTAYRHRLNALSKTLGAQAEDVAFSPLALIGQLARDGDSTAQATVGALMIVREQYDDAIGWLRSASRPGNVIANLTLARIYWEQANQHKNEEDRRRALNQVQENYLHAIALGSADAMYALGSLYLIDAFGEDNRAQGPPLLEQAGALEHGDALLRLAHLYYAGEVVERDPARAEANFIRAASLNNTAARLGYARYLMLEGAKAQGDKRTVRWLRDLVDENEDPEAMLMLGNLHARGIAAEQSIRKARRWYRDAARAAPNDANIINEVAWTLTVSDLTRLRRARFAHKIMTRMMEADDAARTSPEFLDTWAATFAANGNFEEAVRLQELALKEATDADRDDVLHILREHLELFRAGKPVIETAP